MADDKEYNRQFINRLQRVLGLTEEDLKNEHGALAVLCNHAAVRIEWQQSKLGAGQQLVRDLVAWIRSDELIGENEGSWAEIIARAETFAPEPK